MAAPNRATRLTKLVGQLKKRFKTDPPAERPLFETLLYATLAENSAFPAADKALAELQDGYFDWNEVRVSSRPELAERLKQLTDPQAAADRLKRTLQSVFESIYAFDLDALKKQNLGQAVKQIAAYDGVTPFAVAFVTQQGLAGHSIAVNQGVLLALQVMEIITDAEMKKGVVPGLERAVPKSKGVEAQVALHALGVEVQRNPYGTAARKLLVELDPGCKNRLPKKPAPPKPQAEEASPSKASKVAAKKEVAKPAKPTDAKPAAKASTKAAPPKKPAKKVAAEPKPKKPAKKAAPAKKATPKKPAVKKKAPTTKKKAKKKVAKAAPAKKGAGKSVKRRPK